MSNEALAILQAMLAQDRDKPEVKTGAERTQAYRERKRERGEKTKSGKSTRKSKWQTCQFIALDGEGENYGKKEKFKVGTDGKTYLAADHRYTLLAASTGENLYSSGNRLDTMDCINFLCDLGSAYRKAIFVIFAGGYDINHMLMFGFPREELQKISRGETYEFESAGVQYQIEYRARKSLMLKRGLSFSQTGDAKWKDKITIWDVFGFFQENFVAVMGKWLGKEWEFYELIKNMKAKRGDFANVKQHLINQYNEAELKSLVALMEKVHGAIKGLDLTCSRWDGAGAVAAAMLRKHNIREFKDETDALIIDAVRTAYFGGRIEVCKVGCHHGPVYDYDINSAYPSIMMDLPCLAHGYWKEGKGEPPPGFTLVYCEYDFALDQAFYPLPFRTEAMQILFPSEGAGWYWLPEYEAARLCMGNLKPVHWKQWNPICDHKPFSWIKDYYKTRQQWVKHPSEDWHGGAEKIIKLGLNSLYGKTAQQLGGKEDRPPSYHQMEWAGYITSATRARLFLAGMLDSHHVIGFATDGIFTTKPLKLKTDDKKQLGDWSLKEPIPKGMVIAQAGVYWWVLGENKFTHYSRGFDKDAMQTPERIMKAWKEGLDEIDIPMRRLIGMGTACSSDTLWLMRGRFTEGMRTLRLNGKSNKRDPISVRAKKPHLRLVDLAPAANVEFGYGLQECSFPYPLAWIDNSDDEYKNDLEIQKENGDTENI